MLAGNRDTGRVDLCITRVAEVSALPGSFPGGCYVGAHRVGREEEHVAVTAAGQQYCMTEVAFQLTGDQIAGDDAAGFTVDLYDVQHFVAAVEGNITQGHL